jgi:AraC-like DNA-binding protein
MNAAEIHRNLVADGVIIGYGMVRITRRMAGYGIACNYSRLKQLRIKALDLAKNEKMNASQIHRYFKAEGKCVGATTVWSWLKEVGLNHPPGRKMKDHAKLRRKALMLAYGGMSTKEIHDYFKAVDIPIGYNTIWYWLRAKERKVEQKGQRLPAIWRRGADSLLRDMIVKLAKEEGKTVQEIYDYFQELKDDNPAQTYTSKDITKNAIYLHINRAGIRKHKHNPLLRDVTIALGRYGKTAKEIYDCLRELTENNSIQDYVKKDAIYRWLSDNKIYQRKQ